MSGRVIFVVQNYPTCLNNFILCITKFHTIFLLLITIFLDKKITMESETLTKRKSSGDSNQNPKNEEGQEEEIGLKAKMTLMNGVTVIVGENYCLF